MEKVYYKGFEIKIETDNFPFNPQKENDTASTMICQHKKYKLGDENDFDFSDCSNWKDVKKLIIEQKKPLAILPLFLYDHSGITINTTGFSCGYDSGQVGFIFIDKAGCDLIGFDEKWAKQNFPDKTFIEALEEVMKSDVEIYDNYLTGEVYYFSVVGIDDISCGGFFGYDHEKSGLLDFVRSEIDAEIQERIKERIKIVKKYISSKVPLIYRDFKII